MELHVYVFLALTHQNMLSFVLTHWGRVTQIYVGNLTIIGSDNGLSPGRRQAIIWTNARILLIGHLRTNFSEKVIKIETFSLKKIRLKVSSAKRRPFCLGLNELNEMFLIDLIFAYIPSEFNYIIIARVPVQ